MSLQRSREAKSPLHSPEERYAKEFTSTDANVHLTGKFDDIVAVDSDGKQGAAILMKLTDNVGNRTLSGRDPPTRRNGMKWKDETG
ncbi:hypothetical protein R1flu_017208 [Riccia fluitans]|uniref:Uncharacterized protein n=1 Tax=Riccia fluitans TaxID=41844 RepID=A0ABD1XDV7_9MARC